MGNEQYELGLAMGRLAESMDALTDRIAALESDMASVRALMNGGKGAVFGAILVVMFALAGVAGVLKQIKEWAT